MRTGRINSFAIGLILLAAASLTGFDDSIFLSNSDTYLIKVQINKTIAKVVSNEDDTITVLLADIQQDSCRNNIRPNAENSPTGEAVRTNRSEPYGKGSPTDGDKTSDGANGTEITTSKYELNGGQPGGHDKGCGSEIIFTEDEVTYTIADNAVVVKGTHKNVTEKDISEVIAGTLIKFATISDDNGNEEIISIMVIE